MTVTTSSPRPVTEYFVDPAEEIIQSPEETRAREIAGRGNFLRIERELENSGLLEGEIARVSEEYHAIFELIPNITEEDKRTFTILELYDKGTAQHCAETCRIAQEKVEKRLASGVRFSDLFESEYVSLEQFYRACLLHDIGKVEIPRFVITHHMNDDDMNLCLRDLLLSDEGENVAQRLQRDAGEKPDASSLSSVHEYMSTHHLRSVQYVPARLYLAPEEIEELVDRGFDPELSLMDIIREHEMYSNQILQARGLLTEGELAGQHHNYGGRASRYPITSSALHISVDVAELLHIADVEQALTAERSYKKGFSRARVLRIIMEEAEKGHISPEAAYYWVDDAMSEMKFSEEPIGIEDAKHIAEVRRHLERVRRSIELDAFAEDGGRYQFAA